MKRDALGRIALERSDYDTGPVLAAAGSSADLAELARLIHAGSGGRALAKVVHRLDPATGESVLDLVTDEVGLSVFQTIIGG